MYSFYDFKYSLDKNNIINIVDSYYKIKDMNTAFEIFNKLEDILKDNIEPVGLYKIDKKPKEYDFEFLKKCKNIIFCIITLGDKITNKVQELFSSGKFLEGLILDAMSSSLLFEYNSQMYNYLYELALEKNMGITCRIAPGDGEIPIEYQGDIVNRIEICKDYGISVINGYALNPSKSMSYIHGADENLEKIKRLHSCLTCSNTNCFIKDLKQRARNPYKQ